jgi:hypothetical protein
MRALIAFLLLAYATPIFAQYEMRKSSDGVLVVSKVSDRTYTLNVPGKTIVPYGEKQADHPYLTADGTFIQILSVPLAEFKADASAGDEAVLRKQMQYEANYYKVVLTSIDSHTRKVGGRTALVWSFMPTFGPRPVRQVFLTFRAGSYVVVIGSSVERGATKSSIESLLARIAASFHAT